MQVKNILLYFFLVMEFLLLSISSFGQKVTTQEFLEKFNSNQYFVGTFYELIEATKPKENFLNKKIKSELNDKQPFIMIQGEKAFPTPCNLHKIDLEKDKYSLELISLGNMFGFKKTIMIPIIRIFNSQGDVIDNVEISKYETRSPNATLPFHIYSLWAFDIEERGTYYIQVISDNSSERNFALDNTSEQIGVVAGTSIITGSPVVSGAGVITTILLKGYPVKRSPYGKYRMILAIEK